MPEAFNIPISKMKTPLRERGAVLDRDVTGNMHMRMPLDGVLKHPWPHLS